MLLLIGGLVAIAVVVDWPSAIALWRYWTDVPFGGHGLLIIPIVVWIFLLARDRIASAPVQPSLWAVPVLVLCSIASLVLWKAGLQALHILLLPLLILLAVFAAFGAAVVRAVAVPIGYLYFAMPAWNILAAPLQHLTARIVAVLAPVLGLPVIVIGNLISFPDGTIFEITTLCSGVAFMSQGLAAAVLLGELEQAPLGRRVRLVVAMIMVALVANWVRVFAILQIGYATGMRHVLITRGHLLFGWVLFALILAMFMWLATRQAMPAPTGFERLSGNVRSQSLLAGYMAAVAALVAAPILVYILVPTDRGVTASELRLPRGSGGWRGPMEVSDQTWQPEFVGRHSEFHVAYEDAANRRVEMMAIGYSMQAPGRELVSEENSLLGATGPNAASARVIECYGRSYREVVAADNQGHQSVTWSLYSIGGRTFVTPVFSRLWYGLSSFGAAPYSALFAFRTSCASTCDGARDALASFVRGMSGELVAATRQAPLSRRADS